MKRHRLTTLLVPVLMLGVLTILGGCGGDQPTGREIKLAPLSEMPAETQGAPTTVQEAYRFAVANPELVSQFPCYCGCVHSGHESNLDCYIQDTQPDGAIVFDGHAFG
jgi:hypothetical protein